ncbi:peptidoglycan-binding protein [Alphaproteobacteria bacterium]|nr:peptidoglycan-binding protein [Alphaproteobacteria bacterium]
MKTLSTALLTAFLASATINNVAFSASTCDAAIDDWNTVKNSTTCVDYEVFLDYHGQRDCFVVAVAKKRNDVYCRKPSSDGASTQAIVVDTKSDEPSLPLVLQKELTRLGCDPGPADGIWGQKSRSALKKFGEETETEIEDLSPSLAVYNTLIQFESRVCPITCDVRHKLVEGSCQLKKCEQGQTLTAQGQCTRTTENRTPSKPKKSKGSLCAYYKSEIERLHTTGAGGLAWAKARFGAPAKKAGCEL